MKAITAAVIAILNVSISMRPTRSRDWRLEEVVVSQIAAAFCVGANAFEVRLVAATSADVPSRGLRRVGRMILAASSDFRITGSLSRKHSALLRRQGGEHNVRASRMLSTRVSIGSVDLDQWRSAQGLVSRASSPRGDAQLYER